MLIYNYNKEFVGIDKSDLDILGFSNLKSLLQEFSDFAKLFVKSPGCVYDFKHVHWIDFVECANNPEDTEAIILANGNMFKCNLIVNYIYLLEDPMMKSFTITLQHLRRDDEEVSSNKNSSFADIREEVEQENIYVETNNLDINSTQEQTIEPLEGTGIPESITEELELSTATYDPSVAAEELGLPISLINEFISDFISQTNDLKQDFLTNLESEDMLSLKQLSKKLKSVASNLYIQDACDALTKIESSQNKELLKINIDLFYKIVQKLQDDIDIYSNSGQKSQKIPSSNEDEYQLDFK